MLFERGPLMLGPDEGNRHGRKAVSRSQFYNYVSALFYLENLERSHSHKIAMNPVGGVDETGQVSVAEMASIPGLF